MKKSQRIAEEMIRSSVIFMLDHVTLGDIKNEDFDRAFKRVRQVIDSMEEEYKQEIYDRIKKLDQEP